MRFNIELLSSVREETRICLSELSSREAYFDISFHPAALAAGPSCPPQMFLPSGLWR